MKGIAIIFYAALVTGQVVAIASAASPPVATFRVDRELSGHVTNLLTPPLSLAWRFKTGDEISATPVVSGTSVFVGSTDKKIYAIHLESGRAQWTFDAGAPVDASVLFMDGTIYCGTGNGILFAVGASDGAQRWQFDTGAKIAGAANCFSRGATNYVLVGSFNNTLYCLDAASGQLVWTNISNSYINGTPAIYKTSAIYGSCDAFMRIVRLDDGTTLHAYNAGTYIPASPAVYGGHALIATYGGALIRYDMNGRRELWRYAPKDCPWFASPATDGSLVVIGGRDRAIHCLDAATGVRRWKFMTGEQVDSSPLIAGDTVIAASDDGIVYMIDRLSGRELWRYDIGQPVKGSPAVAGRFLIIAATDGVVYGFRKT